MNQQLTWKEYKEFREKEGMPKVSADISMGNDKIGIVTARVEEIKIKDDTLFIYSWNLGENSLYETIDARGHNLFLRFKTSITEEEKEVFLKHWFELQNVSYWGKLNGNPTEMTVDNMGWSLVDDINKAVSKHLYRNNLDNEEKLQFSGGRQPFYMSHIMYYHIEGPRIETFLINGGYYCIKLKDAEIPRVKLSFMTYPTEEEIKEQKSELMKLTEFLNEFLQMHPVKVDPMRGVIPLNLSDKKK